MAKPHALLVTYPLQGHIIPSVHLAIKLASSGIAVTFVNTEAVHRQTARANERAEEDVFSRARERGLDIRYETVSDGLPIEFDRSLHHDEFMGSLLRNLSDHVEPLARRLLHTDPPVTCIVADTFFVWPGALAEKLGLTYVSFWTEPALVFALYYHLDLLVKNGHFGSSIGPRKDTITYIPGVVAIEHADLMSYLQETDTTSVCHQIIFKAFQDVRRADYVLCNTVEELEPKTIAALHRHMPFYAIGPIFPAGFTRSAVSTSLWPESDCTHWLDSRPDRSVLYVSFGSYAHVSKDQLAEIAHGVRDSGVSFLWVLRADIVSSDEPDPLPAGFADGTVDRGMVVPWCRQNAVLSHRSVGGFLTHCGWNSVLESVWCGVPLLCYPLLTDQFTNRKLVVGDWGVGLDLGGVNSDTSRTQVTEEIRRLMTGHEGDAMRAAANSVRTTLESATNNDGSSQRNFDCFVAELMKRNTSGENGFKKN